jgi:hypothetical protein
MKTRMYRVALAALAAAAILQWMPNVGGHGGGV